MHTGNRSPNGQSVLTNVNGHRCGQDSFKHKWQDPSDITSQCWAAELQYVCKLMMWLLIRVVWHLDFLLDPTLTNAPAGQEEGIACQTTYTCIVL